MTQLRVPVLMFHHVEAVPAAELTPPPLHPNSYLARRELAGILDFLAGSGYRTLTLGAAAAACRAGQHLPRRAVVLTFDDGCRCFRDHALPELAARDMTATLFAVSGELGGSNRWDLPTGGVRIPGTTATSGAAGALGISGDSDSPPALGSPGECGVPGSARTLGSPGKCGAPGVTGARDADGTSVTCIGAASPGTHDIPDTTGAAGAAGERREDLLDAAALRALIAAGIEVGSHSRSHRDLTACDAAALAAEVAGSREELAAAIGAPVATFCYPYGRLDERVRAATGAAGYLAAAAIHGVSAARRGDPLALPRLAVNPGESRFELLLKASGVYPWWSRLPRLGLLRTLRRGAPPAALAGALGRAAGTPGASGAGRTCGCDGAGGTGRTGRASGAAGPGGGSR